MKRRRTTPHHPPFYQLTLKLPVEERLIPPKVCMTCWIGRYYSAGKEIAASNPAWCEIHWSSPISNFPARG